MDSTTRPRALARGSAVICVFVAAAAISGVHCMRAAPSAQEEAPTAAAPPSAAPPSAAPTTGSAPIAYDSDPTSGGTGAKQKGAEGAMGGPGDQNAAKAKAAIEAPSYGAAPGIGLGTVGGFGHGAGGGGTGTGMGYGGGAGGGAFGYGGLGVAGVQPAPAPAPIALDPNARYATTYRPGGAALSAFDAALAHGSLPATSKDLVGDFGARYAPALTVPAGSAMTFQVDLDRASIGPKGGPVHLRIAMKGSDVAPARAPLSVHVVLDVSGSMMGVPLANAKKAAEALVDRLDPKDRFSLVTFSNAAWVVAPAGPIGPRKADVVAKIRAIEAGGGTNVSAGLDLGYAQAHAPGDAEGAVKTVMLLSDGHANGGDTDPRRLALRTSKAFQEGVMTSTFGIGTDFDASLLAGLADHGAGAYYYLADSAQIAPALAKELDARLQPVAQALEVRVRLRPGVAATKVFGSHALDDGDAALVRAQEEVIDANAKKKDGIEKDREDDAKGGMRFFVPAFAKGDRHAMLLALSLPAGAGPRTIASVEIRYKDRLAKKNVTQEIAVSETWAASDEAAGKSFDPSVQATVQAFGAGDAIWRAAELVERGDRVGAVALIRERVELLRRAKDALSDARLGDDAARLERLGDAISGPSSVGDPIVLAVLLRGSGSGLLR